MLKQALNEKSTLLTPDLSKGFIIQSDASDHGTGTVKEDASGNERPALYLAHELNCREKAYSTSEKAPASLGPYKNWSALSPVPNFLWRLTNVTDLIK